MTNHHGDFVWYELMTKDIAAARAFYGPMLGWTFADSGMPAMEYEIISMNGTEIAGILPLDADMEAGGAQPGWLGYVGVEDVDASAAQARDAGASIWIEPRDIPGIGRFAFLGDPQGAPIYIMRGNSDEESQSFAKHAPREGHCAWNELLTSDPAGAEEFYSRLFGWEKAETMDMGEMGPYAMFTSNKVMAAGMMRKPEEMPMSAWAYYFRVPHIEAAARYVTANGGQMLTQPMEIPGGEFVFQGLDPQGAMFSLIGKKEG